MGCIFVSSLVILFVIVVGGQDSYRRLVLSENGNEINFAEQISTLKQELALQTATISAQSSQLNSLTSQMTTLLATVATQSTELNTLKQQRHSTETTYVRWGRKTCGGNGTSTVYSGYMAGTYKSVSASSSSGANYLCLTSNPSWSHYTDHLDDRIMITSVEYQFDHWNISDFLGPNVHTGEEAPCAVCLVERGASIMIPGRTQCYPGWTKEYDGYLVTGYPGYDDSTEFVCLDKRPESVAGSLIEHKANNLYFVEARCEFGLECPPYYQGRELACVVCSK